YNQEVALYKKKFEKTWKNADQKTLENMGESIFMSKCSACHGLQGDGQTLGNQKVAANLREFGSEKHVLYVMKNGSKGLGKMQPMMPPQGALLKAMKINPVDVAAYVVTLSGKKAKMGNPVKGKTGYTMVCMACHGPNGKGKGANGMIPNFAADLSKYGTPSYIENIVRKGKNGHIGQMPSFLKEGTLSPIQYKAVATFVANKLND
ncbi:MAG: cytochrome c oxidase cbb3-type subunit 3, partial [bacterium]